MNESNKVLDENVLNESLHLSKDKRRIDLSKLPLSTMIINFKEEHEKRQKLRGIELRKKV